MTKPIFLISLPRSGSTLLQKMLSVHEEISATAEPWLLLPFWAMRRPDAGRSVYSHHTAARAINDFIASINYGDEVFEKAIGDFGRTLYSHSSKGNKYFLDKTPRYYLMARTLSRAFPEAKFIILLRNPLAVLASICETFNKGRFWWPDFWIDWDVGHNLLAELVTDKLPDMYVLHYEDLVMSPEEYLESLCEWLGITYTKYMISNYRESIMSGRMGDTKGINKYARVSTASVDRWRGFFNTKFRRKVALSMLDRIGERNLSILGYPKHEVISNIYSGSCSPKFDIRSRVEYIFGILSYMVDFRYYQERYRARKKGRRYVYGYYRNI